jgi:hypothetical protein
MICYYDRRFCVTTKRNTRHGFPAQRLNISAEEFKTKQTFATSLKVNILKEQQWLWVNYG